MNDLVFIKGDDQYIIRGKYLISSLELFNKKHQRPYLCYQGLCKSRLFLEELTTKGGFGVEHNPKPLLSLLAAEGEEALKKELLRRHSIIENVYVSEFGDIPEVDNPFQLTNAKVYKLDSGLIVISGKYLQLSYLGDEGCMTCSAQESKATPHKVTYKSYHEGYDLDSINRTMKNSRLDLLNTLKLLYNRSLDELLEEIENPALYDDSIYNKEEKAKRLNPSGFLENCLTKESA